MTWYGIDIASFQGTPNFAEVKAAGYSFCLGKSTEGTTYQNPFYKVQREGAVLARVLFGSYHYAQARIHNPIEQAHWFLTRSHFEPWHIVPMLDLEESGSEGCTPSQLEAFAYSWGLQVRKFLDVPKLILYCDHNMLSYRINVTRRLREMYLLDLAEWTIGPPHKPRGWNTVLHQFDVTHHVPGVTGLCDRNRALVDPAKLTISSLKATKAPKAPRAKRPSLLSRTIGCAIPRS